MTVCSCCWLVPAGRPRTNTVRCVCPPPGRSAGAAEAEPFCKPSPDLAVALCATLTCCPDALACRLTARVFADIDADGGKPAAAATPGFDCTNVSSTLLCIARSSWLPTGGGTPSLDFRSTFMSSADSSSDSSSLESDICGCKLRQLSAAMQ